MKTQEELEKFAEDQASFTKDAHYSFGFRDGIILGYNQAKKDNNVHDLLDELFTLANKFSGEKYGHIAVKLHTIHNSINH